MKAKKTLLAVTALVAILFAVPPADAVQARAEKIVCKGVEVMVRSVGGEEHHAAECDFQFPYMPVGTSTLNLRVNQDPAEVDGRVLADVHVSYEETFCRDPNQDPCLVYDLRVVEHLAETYTLKRGKKRFKKRVRVPRPPVPVLRFRILFRREGADLTGGTKVTFREPRPGYQATVRYAGTSHVPGSVMSTREDLVVRGECASWHNPHSDAGAVYGGSFIARGVEYPELLAGSTGGLCETARSFFSVEFDFHSTLEKEIEVTHVCLHMAPADDQFRKVHEVCTRLPEPIRVVP